MNRQILVVLLIALLPVACSANPQQESGPLSILDEVKHGYAENDGVKLHYVSVGDGPLIVMLHGFPDYWYTWRDQINALKSNFHVVAMDLRGYNLSGQPEGIENYSMTHLMDDVIAVIKSAGKEKAIIVGHDWGGAIAWQLAIEHPEVVEKLIVCNMTHPSGYANASIESLRANGNQSYMDDFKTKTAASLPVSWLSGWVTNAAAKKHYEEAFARSSVDGMLNYYRANTKTKEQRESWLENPVVSDVPGITIPVLAIFGTKDQYVDKKGLNNTWDWLDADFTLVTIPTAGHFVQQDASELVSRSMKMWLLRDNDPQSASHDNDKVHADNNANALKDLDWLLGEWNRTSRGRQLVERWTQVSPNTFEGQGIMLNPHGQQEVPLEEILIAAMGDGIFFIPKPKENDLPVAFKLVSQSGQKFVFENPTHDFPQRIEYELVGKGQLKATISDIPREKVIEFLFSQKE